LIKWEHHVEAGGEVVNQFARHQPVRALGERRDDEDRAVALEPLAHDPHCIGDAQAHRGLVRQLPVPGHTDAKGLGRHILAALHNADGLSPPVRRVRESV
jgi:hypothetical protein